MPEFLGEGELVKVNKKKKTERTAKKGNKWGERSMSSFTTDEMRMNWLGKNLTNE